MTGRVSSYCSTGGCVEVEATDYGVVVTDSVDRHVQIAFTADEWDAFLAGVHAGEFSREALRAFAGAEIGRGDDSGADLTIGAPRPENGAQTETTAARLSRLGLSRHVKIGLADKRQDEEVPDA